MCDVNQAGRERGVAQVQKLGGFQPKQFEDMRAMFESKDIDVVSTIANFGTSSFVISHKVYKGDALAIEATEKRVLVGKHPDKPGALKSRPIPQEIIDRFERG